MASSFTFTCDFRGCNASYQRKEHLNRHKMRHAPQQQSFPCPACGRTFERKDTLRRHMRQRHPGDESTAPPRQACISCQDLKSRCEGGPPCKGCLRRNITCSFDHHPRVEGKVDDPQQVNKRNISGQTQRFVQLYFELFHPYWPFLHRGSFNLSNEMPLLVQSMVVIGMWVNDVPNTRSAAINLHKTLNTAIFQQREKWDASTAENASSNWTWPIPMYQAILLHIIFSLICKGPVALNFDLNSPLCPSDADLLASLVQSCRRLGMFQYANIIARYKPDDLAPYVWVGVEEVKRFNIALFKLCKRVNCNRENTTVEGDIPLSVTSWLVNSHELEFPAPTNNVLWDAKGKEEWMAAMGDVQCIDLANVTESEWISKAAELLQLI